MIGTNGYTLASAKPFARGDDYHRSERIKITPCEKGQYKERKPRAIEESLAINARSSSGRSPWVSTFYQQTTNASTEIMQVTLKTADGGFVTKGEILPFNEYPDVVFWGLRTFIKTELPGEYKEAFCVALTPSPVGEASRD